MRDPPLEAGALHVTRACCLPAVAATAVGAPGGVTEPGETWFWSYALEAEVQGEALAPPTHHPVSQPAPGPRGKVPGDWKARLNR